MIVEKNSDLRDTLRHAFEDRGYITWSCPVPELAISIFTAVLPEIVIVDLDFEGINVLRLIDVWREIEPQTRIIVESTNADANRIREAMAHGAQAFLTKPYSLAPLFDLLEKDIPTDPPASRGLKKAA